MSETKLTVQSKSVNSMSLANTIHIFTMTAIQEVFSDVGNNWSGRDWFIELIDSFMYDLAQDKKIVQWDIVCDARNNKMSDMDAGRLNIEVHFQQFNCVNTTRIYYTLSPVIKGDDVSDYETLG